MDPQRLRVDVDELGGNRDHVARALVVLDAHALASFSCSSSSFSRFDSFLGTSMRTRAITSPRPEPLRRGAPLPLTRRSLPSSEPDGIFTCTGPSGVGTDAFVPRAASAKGTAMST